VGNVVVARTRSITFTLPYPYWHIPPALVVRHALPAVVFDVADRCAICRARSGKGITEVSVPGSFDDAGSQTTGVGRQVDRSVAKLGHPRERLDLVFGEETHRQ
jgi:hypothetical protein